MGVDRAPAGHLLLIALAIALYAATLPFSIMHLDLARDIAHGLAIARGERFPLEGPVLASSVHAGPLWYYLLALPLAAWPAWLSVTLFVGAVAALKFPLAYVAGTRLVDRRTGLIWALLLLYPGWMTFEAVLQNHASLVATCTLAVLVVALGYLESGSRRNLVVAGLLFGVALHAHPSTAGIGVLLLAAVAWRARRSGASALADFAIVSAAAIVPFAPYLGSQAASEFPDFSRAVAFVGDQAGVGGVTRLPNVLAATFVGGGRVVASDMLARLPAAPTLVLAITVVLLGTSAYGILVALKEPSRRTALVAGIVAVFVLAATVTAIRGVTPFYMTFVVWTIAAGVVATGLSACAPLPFARWVARGSLAAAAVLVVATQTGVADTLRRGAYPFAFYPLFDVTAPSHPGAPMPFLVARTAGASGMLLCDAPALAAHGSYGVHLLHVYAMEARLSCGRSANVMLGGADEGSHRAGVSRTIADGLGFVAMDRLGPLMLLDVVQVVNPRRGAAIPDPGTYPPVTSRLDAPTLHVLDFESAREEAVLVTDLYFAFVVAPMVTATANGSALAPVARDRVSTAFLCGSCAPGVPVKWRISVNTPAIERVDIVTVRSSVPLR